MEHQPIGAFHGSEGTAGVIARLMNMFAGGDRFGPLGTGAGAWGRRLGRGGGGGCEGGWGGGFRGGGGSGGEGGFGIGAGGGGGLEFGEGIEGAPAGAAGG